MNLSSRSLTVIERSLLMKSLNFSVTPSKIPVADIIAATEHACSQLKDKSQAESLRSEIVKKNSQDQILTKQRSTVILNKQHYQSKVKTSLDDTKAYEKLTSDPTRSIKNKLIQILRYWRRESRISEFLYHSAVFLNSTVFPRSMRKMLRPIVSSAGSVMYNTAKFVAKILRPTLVGLNDHHFISSEDFIDKIEVPPGQELVSNTMFRRCLLVSRSTKLFQLLDRNWKVTQLYQIDVLWMYHNYPPYLKCAFQIPTYFTFQDEFYEQK